MKESRIKFIMKAHNESCSDWKQQIENEFPKLFTKSELELYKWYKSSVHTKMTIYPTKSDNKGNLHGYGFNRGCDWVEEGNYIKGTLLCNDVAAKDLIPATDKEVEKALIKEAKRRYSVPCSVIYFDIKKIMPLRGYSLDFIDGKLYAGNKKEVLFENGKWAEIIQTITKEEAEKELGKTIVG